MAIDFPARDVEDAKSVLHGLETKLSDARARHADTQAKAAELAYPGLSLRIPPTLATRARARNWTG